MAIDFPASPSLNDTFSSGGVTYTWDGTVWAASGSAAFLVAGEGIDALGDVTITAPANEDVLKYNGTAWVNSPLSIPSPKIGIFELGSDYSIPQSNFLSSNLNTFNTTATVVTQTGGVDDFTCNGSEITFNISGTFELTFMGSVDMAATSSNQAGGFLIQPYKNNATSLTEMRHYSKFNDSTISIRDSFALRAYETFAVNDVWSVRCARWENTGGSKSVDTGSSFKVEKVA